MLSGQATELAARFRAMNERVIRFAAGRPAADWGRKVPYEGRSVAYLIDYIADWRRSVASRRQSVPTVARSIRAQMDQG